MVAKRSSEAVQLTTDDEPAAPGMIMDATRLAAVCDTIDDYFKRGAPMNRRQVAAVCAMIDGRAVSRRDRRMRRRNCVDSTRRYEQQTCPIGSGTYGVVAKASHRGTGRTVAVKTFPAPHAGEEEEPSDVTDVLREACFLAACRGHQNLVGFHGVARDPATGDYSLVMEYVGPSLRSALTDRLEKNNRRAFPEAAVRGVMRQLLAGAEAMHARRVIHCDIKPGNALVGDGGIGDGVVKICDLGLAMSTAETRPPYGSVGTARYMAPEVLTDMPEYDERVDTWSLGCVMVELLSGEALFKADYYVGGDDDVHRQIDRMFDVLDAPAVETWETFMPPLMGGEVLRRQAARPRPPCPRGRLRELFPCETLSQDGFDVLRGLLACNPKERLTAAAALRLPWFTTDTGDSTILGDRASPFVRVLNSVWTLVRQIALPLIVSCPGIA